MGPLELIERLADLPLGGYTIGNLGAGKCESAISHQVCDLPCAELINVEVWGPYVEILQGLTYKAAKVSNVLANIAPWLLLQAPRSIDVILMIDVLEHLDKVAGTLVLSNCIRVASRRVLLWLPIGQCAQGPYDHNPYQEHRSTWELDEFKQLGASNIEYLTAYHRHFNPPVDAAWVTFEVGNET